MDLNLEDLMLELDLAYKFLAIEVYGCDLVAHELLLGRFPSLEHRHFTVGAHYEKHIVELASVLHSFLKYNQTLFETAYPLQEYD